MAPWRKWFWRGSSWRKVSTCAGANGVLLRKLCVAYFYFNEAKEGLFWWLLFIPMTSQPEEWWEGDLLWFDFAAPASYRQVNLGFGLLRGRNQYCSRLAQKWKENLWTSMFLNVFLFLYLFDIVSFSWLLYVTLEDLKVRHIPIHHLGKSEGSLEGGPVPSARVMGSWVKEKKRWQGCIIWKRF